MSRVSVADALARVHREVSPAMGYLCVALERRVIRTRDLLSCAEALRRAAEQIEDLAHKLGQREVDL